MQRRSKIRRQQQHSELSSTSSSSTADVDCPCQDPIECETISGPPIRIGQEIFGFYSPHKNNTNFFNWTHVTSIAWASDAIVCTAHRHGVRAIAATPSMNLTEMAINPSSRDPWIEDALGMVKSRFMDGITFDYEGALAIHSAEAKAYVALVRETRERFHQANPSLQVTTCVGWSPDGIDGRNYDYKALAEASDALYVMDYDTQSQIYDGACLAGANAPYYGMIHGMTRYLDLGIPPTKLILGVPWYGYRYPCLPGTTRLNDRFCPIESVPFRDVPCSDAVGVQQGIPHMFRQWREAEKKSPIQYDGNMDAHYFNALQGETIYQHWFDDGHSLRRKYAWARSNHIAGVGPYSFVHVDPGNDESDESAQIRQSLWSAFDAFLSDTDNTDFAQYEIKE